MSKYNILQVWVELHEKIGPCLTLYEGTGSAKINNKLLQLWEKKAEQPEALTWP